MLNHRGPGEEQKTRGPQNANQPMSMVDLGLGTACTWHSTPLHIAADGALIESESNKAILVHRLIWIQVVNLAQEQHRRPPS